MAETTPTEPTEAPCDLCGGSGEITLTWGPVSCPLCLKREHEAASRELDRWTFALAQSVGATGDRERSEPVPATVSISAIGLLVRQLQVEVADLKPRAAQADAYRELANNLLADIETAYMQAGQKFRRLKG